MPGTHADRKAMEPRGNLGPRLPCLVRATPGSLVQSLSLQPIPTSHPSVLALISPERSRPELCSFNMQITSSSILGTPSNLNGSPANSPAAATVPRGACIPATDRRLAPVPTVLPVRTPDGFRFMPSMSHNSLPCRLVLMPSPLRSGCAELPRETPHAPASPLASAMLPWRTLER